MGLADIGFCGYLLYTFSKLFLDSICATMSYFSGFGTPLPKLIHFCSGSWAIDAAIHDFFFSLEDKIVNLDFKKN